MEYFIYALCHTYTDEWHTDFKLLGFLHSLKGVEEMKKQAVILPGFKAYPDGFDISELDINILLWKSGF